MLGCVTHGLLSVCNLRLLFVIIFKDIDWNERNESFHCKISAAWEKYNEREFRND